MIVCKNCGHHNEDNDTFCGSCGKFLEWTGERVAVAEPEPPPPPPAPAAEPEPTRVGLIDRVRHAVGIEENQASAAPTAEPASPPAPDSTRTVPVMSSTSSATRPAAAPPASSAATGMAAAPPAAPPPAPVRAAEPVLAGVGAPLTSPQPTTAPVAQGDEPMSRRPTSLAPTISRPRPAKTMEAPTRRRPGDLICGQCGEGNDPARHFCRRCGNSLDEAIAVSLPWYRRFFNRVLGVRTREAGWRPKRVGGPNVVGGAMRMVRLVIGAILVVAVLAFIFIPTFHNLVVDRATAGFTTVRKIVRPNYDPINPTGASASTAIAAHPPTLAKDSFSNTYWAASPNDRTPTLVLTFAGPQDLAQIGFTSGAAPSDQFLTQPRPKAVHLVFSDGSTKDLNLADSKTAQFFAIDAKQVTKVEIHILSVWPTAGAAPSAVAITEVEFRVKD